MDFKAVSSENAYMTAGLEPRLIAGARLDPSYELPAETEPTLPMAVSFSEDFKSRFGASEPCRVRKNGLRQDGYGPTGREPAWPRPTWRSCRSSESGTCAVSPASRSRATLLPPGRPSESLYRDQHKTGAPSHDIIPLQRSTPHVLAEDRWVPP